MSDMKHLTMAELEAGLDHIRQAPRDGGELMMIVRRPETDGREVLAEAELDLAVGLVGDNWQPRGSSRMKDGSAHPEMQLNVMNVRVIELLCPDEARRPLAGDQLYIDIDLSDENLPAGSRLALGEAIIEVTAEPHNGCKKFAQRFGVDAVKFVNSAAGKELHLRGINAKVVQAGTIRQGDVARKL